MKINDTIKLCCDFLGENELKDLIGTQNADEVQQAKINALLTCLNLAYEEIVTEYLPILCTQTLSVSEGEIAFSQLSNPISGIVSVKDENGNDLSYLQSADHIEVNAEKVVITYQIVPEKFDFGDEANVIFPERLLAYGTCREFLFMQGLSEEALLYEKRFKDALINFVRKKSSLILPKRQWAS